MADKVMQYVGARYVPKFANPVEWQSNTSYEALTIVTYNNSSYTSKIPVPATVGNPAENSDYWVATGNYNAQVDEYRQTTEKFINYSFIPPEYFGAVGDGETDDTEAIDAWLNSSFEKLGMFRKTYKITKTITCNKNHVIIGNGGTIDVADEITPADVHLIKFNGLDNLIIDNVNFNISAIHRSPFVDDSVENHDGILVRITDSNNVRLTNCSFTVVKVNHSLPCTPVWVTGTCKNILIDNCVVSNKGYAQRSGAIWFYGHITNAKIDNCDVYGSTLDEIITTWGGSNDLLVTNCTVESLAKNDQMFAFYPENCNTIIDNCVLKFAENVINYRAIKCGEGNGVVKNCKIYYNTIGESCLFSVGNIGRLVASNNLIYVNIEDNSNGGILNASDGEIVLMDNKIVDIGSHHCTIGWLRETANVVKLIGNEFTLPNEGPHFYFSGYNDFELLNNVFVTGTQNLTEYTFTENGAQKKLIYGNILTNGVDSKLRNMNPSLKCKVHSTSESTPDRINNGGSYDFSLPTIYNHDRQVGIVVVRDIETGTLEVGAIQVSNENVYRYTEINSNDDFTVSVSDNKLHVVDNSIYGGYVSVTTFIYLDYERTC